METIADVREWIESLDAYEGTREYDESIARCLPVAWRIVMGSEPMPRDGFSVLCTAF